MLRPSENPPWSEKKELVAANLKKLAKTPPVRWDVVLAPGMHGPREVSSEGTKKRQLYPVGVIDGNVRHRDAATAVYAFQKVNGLLLDGSMDGADMEQRCYEGPPNLPNTRASDYIDVDITRQVLFEVHDGELFLMIPISTGNGAVLQLTRGTTAIASTPRGDFEFYNKIPGWRISHLGASTTPHSSRAVTRSTAAPRSRHTRPATDASGSPCTWQWTSTSGTTTGRRLRPRFSKRGPSPLTTTHQTGNRLGSRRGRHC